MAYELAQLNVATAISGDVQDSSMEAFWLAVPDINALADEDPGMVWRLQDEVTGNAGTFRIPEQDAMIVNLSVWKDIRALHSFVFRSGHKHIMARKDEWFVEPALPTTVLWWVEKGHRPTVKDAWDRLQQLRAKGPQPTAFTFSKRFDPPSLA